ncbi:hypothetical protein CC117_30275 [Parafrankia colletiae]|uniref:Spore-associated protein A n=1 Tax=Parafrankia colletiae TaxID=573497 RepID=A0A1S1Q544_9ACTN|nr:hypothetical protein [Parafrankia colletiae]MCK9904240.1 hypothetical protein [Frankia sp. Cpl3]OHV28591.1 hypothetical protein CC117_30275 [Parafrankia colletiae]
MTFLVALMLGLGGGAILVSPSAAHAATYGGQCGPGFNVIDSVRVTGGTVFLTYSSATKENCVVTVRDTPGDPVFMYAEVALSGDQDQTENADDYTDHTRPVYVYAPSSCIDWGGGINNSAIHAHDVHCG